MADEFVFTAAARLESLWSDKLDELLADASCATMRIESHDLKFGSISGDSVSALFAIIDKILVRGKPTLCAWEYENYLLLIVERLRAGNERASRAMHLPRPIPRRTDDQELGYRFDSLDIDDLVERARALLSGEGYVPDCRIRLPDMLKRLASQYEVELVERIGEIAPRLLPMLHWQARLAELCTGMDVQTSNERVDFAFVGNKQRMVIEVDGPQHRVGVTTLSDQKRNELLKSSGWKIGRIATERLREVGTDAVARKVAELLAVPCDRPCDDNLWGYIQDHLDMEAALLLVLYPNALHQCVRALVQLYLRGVLPYDRRHTVKVIEEDLLVVHEAFVVLWNMWENLTTIYPQLPKPPQLVLHVQQRLLAPMIAPMQHPAITAVSEERTGDEWDLILSHSAFLGSWQIGKRERVSELPPGIPRVAIRRGISVHDHRQIELVEKTYAADLDYLEQYLRFEPDADQLVRSDKAGDRRIKRAHAALRYFLQGIFRFRGFRSGQLRSIARLLQRKDTIVLLPTGAGKSLIFQYSSMLQPGATLVVDPLLSLMLDQVDNLRSRGFDTVEMIGSMQEQSQRHDVLERFGERKILFLYVTPERLQNPSFREQLRATARLVTIPFAVVDEAHCLSEWGHDFRVSYLHLPRNLRKYCATGSGDEPTIIALTGTASYSVLRDLRVEMEIKTEDSIVTPPTFDRPELTFDVHIVDDPEARFKQLEILRQQLPKKLGINPRTFFLPQGADTCSGIVFVPHVNGPLGALEIANRLGHRCYYTGDAPKGVGYGDHAEHKRNVQERFKRNEIQELVATKSFGMGIDKPNIRYTIHYVMPQSIEGFYQEAGRAGRDGNKSYCAIIYSPMNRSVFEDVLFEGDWENARKIFRRYSKDVRGDLGVQLWFVYNSYKGVGSEISRVVSLFRTEIEPRLGRVRGTVKIELANSGRDENGIKNDHERSLYRLMLLGIVKDYTVKWSTQGKFFEIECYHPTPKEMIAALQRYLLQYKPQRYVGDMIARIPSEETLPEAIEPAIRVLIEFIYSEIVSRRKQAIRQMCDLCESFRSDEEFRRQMLNYLQESEFSGILKEWLGKGFDEIGLVGIHDVLSRCTQEVDWQELLGTLNRMLTDDPTNLPLLLLRLLVRIRTSDSESITDSDARELARQLNHFFEHRQRHHESIRQLLFDILADVYASRPKSADRVVRRAIVPELTDGLSDELYTALCERYDRIQLPELRRLCQSLQLRRHILRLQPIVDGLDKMLNNSAPNTHEPSRTART
ncbi:MAG: RecQ family ATP-dependent DNA helicase [Chlorobi bacterium]|nr:RecQ family ATP-dependent DNA helicase [Chlorobiota bacterium]